MRFVTLFFLFIFSSLPLLAETEGLQEVQTAFPIPSYGKDFLNMICSLFLLLGFLLGSVWFIKRILRSRFNAASRNSSIQILEKRTLTPKSSLYLISVLGKALLIADSQQGIEMLAEFPYEEESEKINENEAEPFLKTSFANLLQKKMLPK